MKSSQRDRDGYGHLARSLTSSRRLDQPGLTNNAMHESIRTTSLRSDSRPLSLRLGVSHQNFTPTTKRLSSFRRYQPSIQSLVAQSRGSHSVEESEVIVYECHIEVLGISHECRIKETHVSTVPVRHRYSGVALLLSMDGCCPGKSMQTKKKHKEIEDCIRSHGLVSCAQPL